GCGEGILARGVGGGRFWRSEFVEVPRNCKEDGHAGVSAAGRRHPAGQSSFKYRIKFQSGALRCWRRIMLNLWHAYIQAAQVGWDANVVVAMRLMRLAVGGALAQREAQRMVTEKVTAIAEAQAAAVTKMIMGGGMAAATKSASAVYRRKGRANQRRLTRRWFRPTRRPNAHPLTRRGIMKAAHGYEATREARR